MARAYGPNLGVNVVEGRTPHVIDLPFSKATANFGTTTRTTYNKNGVTESVYSGGTDLYLSLVDVVEGTAQGYLARALDNIHTSGHASRLNFTFNTDGTAAYDRPSFVFIPIVSALGYTELFYKMWFVGGKSNIATTASEAVTVNESTPIDLSPYAPALTVPADASAVFMYTYTEVVDGGRLTEWTQTPQQCALANSPVDTAAYEYANFLAINTNGSCAATYSLYFNDRAKFTYIIDEYYPDGWEVEGDRYLAPVRPMVNVYRELGADAVVEQYPASDVPLINVGYYPDLPNRNVGGVVGQTIGLGDVEYTFPAMTTFSGWYHAHHHSRFVQYMKHVAGDVFIFPYFLSRLSYATALSLWKGMEPFLVSSDPDVWEDQPLYALAPLNCLGNDPVTCDSDGAVLWDVQLGYTTDNFATMQTITDYSGVTFTPISIDGGSASHLGVRKYVNDSAYISPKKFDSDAMFPTCLLFKLTSPQTAPLAEDGTKFIVISAAPMAPSELTGFKFKFPVYTVNLNVDTITEGYTFEFDNPVGIISMHRLYNNIVLQVIDTGAANHTFYLSIDDGVSWTATTFTQVEKAYTGVMSTGLVDDVPSLLLPTYDSETQTYRVLFMRVSATEPLVLDDEWVVGGKLYNRDEDDPVPDPGAEMLTQATVVQQMRRGQDWFYREKQPFKKATVIE